MDTTTSINTNASTLNYLEYFRAHTRALKQKLVNVPGSPCPLTPRQAAVVEAVRQLIAEGEFATPRAIAARAGITNDAARNLAMKLRPLGIEGFEVTSGHDVWRPSAKRLLSDAELAERIAAVRRETVRRREAGTLTPEWYLGVAS